MPFILRGVSLLGVNSAVAPRDIRMAVWQRLASDLKPRHLDRIVTREIALTELPARFRRPICKGSVARPHAGRVSVTRVTSGAPSCIERRRGSSA